MDPSLAQPEPGRSPQPQRLSRPVAYSIMLLCCAVIMGGMALWLTQTNWDVATFAELRLAAALGRPSAMCVLGGRYLYGQHGVQIDYERARHWYTEAAGRGSASAMNQMGWIYQEGLGVEHDDQQAMRWYRAGVEAGSPDAMGNIGSLYANGAGVSRDYSEAMHWYMAAAEMDNELAMYNAAILHEHGLGVARSWRSALEWYMKAVRHGSDEAMDRIRELHAAGDLDSETFAQAQDQYEAARSRHLRYRRITQSDAPGSP
jgi:TPR repeat protein